MKFITKKKHRELKKGHLKVNDILITTRGNIGIVAIVPPSFIDANINAQIVRLKVNEFIITPKFLLYVLKSKQALNLIKKRVTGTALKQLPVKVLTKLKIPVPPLDVQEKIVEVLEKAEKLKEKRKEANEETNQLIQSIFYEMFGDPIKNEKGWKVKKLGEVCDVRDGTHESPKYINEGYPLVTSKNVKEGYIDFSDVNFISKEDYDNINKRSFVDDGDIIMPMIGTIGNPVIVKKERDFAIKNVALIKFENSEMSNIYIYSLLKSSYFNYITKRNSRGGTQKFIALKDIRNIPILLPPLSLQNEFAEKVKRIEALKEKQKQSTEEINNLFNALMQKAFKGELVK